MPLAPFRMSFSPASVRRFEALMAAEATMAKYYLAAMTACVNVVKTEAVHITQQGGVFKNPQGTLSGGLRGYPRSPFEGVVGVVDTVPYARRREFGFTGMTDSLGRYYASDPGAFYLQTALKNKEAFIAETFGTEVALSIRYMAQ